MAWKKCLRFYRVTKCFVVTVLILVNAIMALFTIPLMIGGKDDAMETDVHVNKNMAVNLVPRDMEPKQETLVSNSSDLDDYPHEYFYLLQPTTGCEDENPFLLIVVCSAVQHFDLRQTIRETWASVIRKHRLSTKLVFMLGAPSLEYTHLQDHVIRESLTHGDVIQEDFVDSYVNLTIKSIGVLKWAANFCEGVKYLMKTDDDIFINVANLISLLMDISTQQKTSQSKLMLGHLIENAKPISDRISKWYAPTTLFRENAYPKYLSGSAYVISGNLIGDMYSAATLRKAFWLEDIFITGMLSVQLNIPLIHDKKFTYRKPKLPHPCFYKTVISAHELSATELGQIWSSLHSSDVDCTGYRPDFVN